jgi:hypothetical protein
MFDLLVYTDSDPNESLHGGTGFQFIAASPGAAPSDESFVRQAALQHVVPQQLDAAAWTTHPETCAFTRNGRRLYLSRGRSTGDTIGGRPGNQSTTTIMSSDPYDVLPLRPAQLFSSPAWPTTRPTTQSLDPWVTPVEVAEDFGMTALHAMCVGDEWTRSSLPAFLTMLERTQVSPRTKLLVRHRDQRTVMRWVALLSSFLDADASLQLTFRVFSADPVAENADVVGVHPLLTPNLGVGNASGVNLIDLEVRDHSSIEVSDSAFRHARWFLTGDPFEAIDAIEVSRRWSRSMPADDAAAASELAIMGSTRPASDVFGMRTSVRALRALAGAGADDELEAWGDELADVVAGCAPSTVDDLLAIDDAFVAASRIGQVDVVNTLLLTALEWAAAKPELAAGWCAARSSAPRVDSLDGDARLHAERLLAGMLAAADDDVIVRAFSLAGRFVRTIDAAEMPSVIDRLVAVWLRRPAVGEHLAEWVAHEVVLQRLVLALRSALESGDAEVSASFTAGAWDPLRSHDSAALVPMAIWFVARDLQVVGLEQRQQLLETVVGDAPSAAWRLFLLSNGTLLPDEVAAWSEHHAALPVDFLHAVAEALERPSREWATGADRVLDVLSARDVTTSRLDRALDAHRRIRGSMDVALRQRATTPNPGIISLGQSDGPTVADLHADRLLMLLPAIADADGAMRLLESQRAAGLQERLRVLLATGLASADIRWIRVAIRLLDPRYGRWADAARRALDDAWDDPRSRMELDRAIAGAGDRLSAADRTRLQAYLDEQSRGRFARGVLRGAKSLFSNRND